MACVVRTRRIRRGGIRAHAPSTIHMPWRKTEHLCFEENGWCKTDRWWTSCGKKPEQGQRRGKEVCPTAVLDCCAQELPTYIDTSGSPVHNRRVGCRVIERFVAIQYSNGVDGGQNQCAAPAARPVAGLFLLDRALSTHMQQIIVKMMQINHFGLFE